MLAACGGSSRGPSADSTTGTLPTTLKARARPDGEKTLNGYTAPGAVLFYGQAATVLYPDRVGAHNYTLLVRVLPPVRVPQSAGGASGGPTQTTYYVRYQITNLGPGTLTLADAEAIIPIAHMTGDVSFSGSFFGPQGPCDSSIPPRRFIRGVTWTTCDPYNTTGHLLSVVYNAASGVVPIYWR
jgi:hypothetical protein